MKQAYNPVSLRKLLFVFALCLASVNFSIAQRPSDPTLRLSYDRGIALYEEAEELLAKKSRESSQAAIAKLAAAAENFRQGKSTMMEAASLFLTALCYMDLKHYTKAVEVFDKTLPLWRAAGQTSLETQTLKGIAKCNDELGNKSKAIELYTEVLKREKADRDFENLPGTLIGLGHVYLDLDENQKALDHYLQALPFIVIDPNRKNLAILKNKIGLAYQKLGENEKSLVHLSDALAIYREIDDKNGVAAALTNMGASYTGTGMYEKALESLQSGLRLWREIPDEQGVATAFEHFGTLYDEMGEPRKALRYYEDALATWITVGEKDRQATMLNALGLIHSKLGDKWSGINFYTKAAAIWREVGNKRGEAAATHNSAEFLLDLGHPKRALELYERSLELSRSVKDRAGEANALQAIGSTHFQLGNKVVAAEYQLQAIPIQILIGDKRGEATSYFNLMFTSESLGKHAVAGFFGKLSINAYQDVRKGMQGLDRNLRQKFVKDIEKPYRLLAESLIKQGRASEAIQVLNRFKGQQFFDIQASAPLEPLTLNKFEEGLSVLLRPVQKGDSRVPGGVANEAAQTREADFGTQMAKLLALIKDPGPTSSNDQSSKQSTTEDVQNLQKALADNASVAPTVAVYTLIGDEALYLLVITPTDIKTTSVPIDDERLKAQVMDLWRSLRDSWADPRPAGQQLFRSIVLPLKQYIPKGTTALLWSLDGSLRYVPMAALFDGKQYLAESFASVSFTRTDYERMTKPLSPVWTGTAFGSTKGHTVTHLGESMKFESLPGVLSELNSAFSNREAQSMYTGEVLLDETFTKDSFYSALAKRRPVVHIATHFVFKPGNEGASFLLLGNGTPLTLTEFSQQTKVFEGVDLLVLSACNTAAQQADADGREVDAFAELSQRLGASSVLATLWPVADAGTAAFMNEFYAAKKKHPLISKAIAIQKAQRHMINGTVKSSGTSSGCRSEKFGKGSTKDEFKCDPNAPYSHPYFWSPFVLIGNWR